MKGGGVRFHFAYTLRYIKYGLALAVIPMLRLLFRLDFENFLIALQQDIIILLSMAAVSLPMWLVTRCYWQDGRFEVSSGFLFFRRQVLETDKVAVVEISRPLHYRLMGASIVTVYTVAGYSPRKRKVILKKRDAVALRDALLPCPPEVDTAYRIKGWERVLYVLLSANVLTALLVAVMGYRQIRDILDDTSWLEGWLLNSFNTLESWFEVVLPAGAAVLLTLVFLLVFFTLFYSFLHTFGFTAQRRGGILVERCGLWTRTERYILLRHVTWCDVRHTPLSRLLHKKPVYIAAGGYKGSDVPLLLCRNEEDEAIQALVPGYQPPGGGRLASTGPKSFFMFIWVPLSLFGLFGLLYITAMRVLPGILPLLALPLFLCAGCIPVHIEAYFLEGARAIKGRGLSACYSHFFTRHSLSFLSPDLALKVSETPVGAAAGRATLHITTPGRQRFKVRGVGRYTARHIRFSF